MCINLSFIHLTLFCISLCLFLCRDLILLMDLVYILTNTYENLTRGWVRGVDFCASGAVFTFTGLESRYNVWQLDRGRSATRKRSTLQLKVSRNKNFQNCKGLNLI
jgi:hypothetical protein